MHYVPPGGMNWQAFNTTYKVLLPKTKIESELIKPLDLSVHIKMEMQELLK